MSSTDAADLALDGEAIDRAYLERAATEARRAYACLCPRCSGVDLSDGEAWRAWYAAYLRTSEWSTTRKLAIERAGGQCERCPNPAREVHHVSYLRLGHEDPADLIALCTECHDRQHAGRRP